jgi:tetratricopeptide (TPR) repeat protein
MKPSAPARSGLLSDRLAPWLSAAIGAFVLAGCSALPPGSDAAGSTQGDGSQLQAPAVGDTAQRVPTAAQTGGAGSGTAQTGDSGTPTARGVFPGHAAEGSPQQLPEVPLTSQLLFQILASEIAAQLATLGSAATTYLAIARQTRDPRLAQRATELAVAARMPDAALSGSELWHELAPGSSRAAQTHETLLLSTGELDKAEPLLRERLTQARAEERLPAAYQQLQRILVRASDPVGGLAMLERLAEPDSKVPSARLALAALARAAGDVERAASEAKAALQLAPDDENMAVSAAQFVSESKGGPEEAIALLQRFLKRQPQAIDARFTLGRMLAGAGREDAAREQFERALAQDPDSPAILFSLAQLAWQTKQPKVAEKYLHRYLSLPDDVQRDDNPAWLFLGQIAEDQGRPADAIEHYSKVRRGEQAVPALIRRAMLLNEQGKLDEARKLLQDTPALNNRDRVQLISAEAALLREAGRSQQALDLLAEALQRLPENPDLLYDYAMVAERVDRLDIMETSLRKLMVLRPDHAHAYNALGYTFADRNMRLDEAEELIARALELRPGDPHIIDSMGWLLYRRGDLPGAIELLRKAWALSPETDIAAHLGEVLWKAGQTEEARELWRAAQKREPDNATLRETLARLNVSL